MVVAVLQNVELDVLQIAQENVLAIVLVLVKTLLLHAEQVVQALAQKIALLDVRIIVLAYVLLDALTLAAETAVEIAVALVEQVVPTNLVKAALDNVLKDAEILAQ